MLQFSKHPSLFKHFTILIIFCSISLSSQSVLAQYSGGNGIPIDPYRIRTIDDWQTFMNTSSDWNKYFILISDIDLKNVTIKPVGAPFPDAGFFGTFDGNGHIINNANINTHGEDNAGLFGNLGLNGQIRNLSLTNCTINGRNNVGALVGYNWGGDIINCQSSGEVSGNMSVGGLIGENSEGTIAQSESSCTVNCTYNAGGLIGYNNKGTITQCYSTGAISGTLSTGGLVGDNTSGTITQSYSTGAVSGGYNSGGLTGYNTGTIAQCNSTSEVTGQDYVGTLVGYNWEGTLAQSYTAGSANGNYDVGDLLGYNHGGTIAKCYSTGFAIGIISVGGLIGENSSGIVTECYSTSSVSGSHVIGGLVGNNNDIVTFCYSASTVSGDESVGGLNGFNGGDVNDCYSTGVVSCTGNYAGGLAGENEGNIIRCYSISSVRGSFDMGGLVGSGLGNVMCSIWDMETSGLSGSVGGTGLTTAQMMSENMLSLNGFASDPNWILDAGNDYPRLAWEGTPGSFISQPDLSWLNGAGTEENPYQIDTAEQLVLAGKASILSDKHYILNEDITLDIDSVNPDYAAPNLEDELIFGQSVIPVFSGVFDGNDHTVSNMIIDGGSFLGLFGRLEPEAQVKNLSIEDANIVGSGSYIGGLNGYNKNGTVTMCSSTGTVNGYAWVGGMMGYNSEGDVTQCYSSAIVDANLSTGGLLGENVKGNVTQCYSTGTVSGNADVGGLIGYNWDGAITQSYSTGSTNGDIYVGGLVGENVKGNIDQCYSTGIVSGDYETGGLVGSNYYSYLVNKSFWDIQTSGKTTSDGGTGKTTTQMMIQSTFTNAGWDFSGETANGKKDIWSMTEGQEYPKLSWQKMLEN
ncbi:MAG: hypothetical protein JXA96_00355 [Sedimentisphaerales bacterium]|nr:hypothetical protein [Sedimentisphaerales bacterium]